jgi:CRISPR-associated endonuclease Cas2
MFAISFDLTVEDTERHHPKGVSQAYSDIRQTLEQFGFERIQGSVYVCQSED